MLKKGVLLVFIFFISVFAVSFVIAETSLGIGDSDSSGSGNEFNNCQDYCSDFITRAMPACPGELDVSGDYPDCSCWKCEDGFDENNIKGDVDDDFDGDLEEEYGDEEIVDPGMTPDSAFYFLDEFFDRFGDEIENREEKIAEIKAMVEQGDFDSAHEALEKYKKYADEIERESDPERRDDARRSAAAIRHALNDIREDIPENERAELYDGVIERENSILTAVEISSKIKELCVQLADLDPVQYSKVCNVGDDDDAPSWKRRLHEDLTEEQRIEAKEFGEIMSQCFETSGRDCRCEDISFYDFSVACSQVAPLAAQCDEGDEDACEQMDDIEMPELPDYLEDIFEEIEDRYGEDKYDMHMPKECVEEGATTPRECGKIMIRIHAPPECKDALLEANVQSESEGREICDKIMMEIHAPECAAKGITNPEECGEMMMPDECKEKGISDRDECEELMRSLGPRGQGPGGFGPPGRDCMSLQDSGERLKCFEEAVGGMGNHYGVGERFEGQQGEITWQCKENRIHWGPDCEKFMMEEWPEQERMRNEERHKLDEQRSADEYEWSKEKEQECANSCDLENGWWDFRGGECVCYANEDHENFPTDDYPRDSESSGGGGYGDSQEGGSCDDCASQCESRSGQRLSETDCVNNHCECYYESDEPTYGPGEGPEEDGSDGGSVSEPSSEPESESAPEPDPSPELNQNQVVKEVIV